MGRRSRTPTLATAGPGAFLLLATKPCQPRPCPQISICCPVCTPPQQDVCAGWPRYYTTGLSTLLKPVCHANLMLGSEFSHTTSDVA